MEENPKRKEINVKRKCQAFAVDLLIGVVIFFMVFSILFSWRDSLFSKQIPPDEFQRTSLKASEIAFVLLESPGDPLAWNSSSVKQVGLAFERNVVDKGRLANFLDLAYDNVTRLLGVWGYDFYFELRYLNGTVASVNESGIVDNATVGALYDNYSLQVPLRKLVLFNSEEAVMLVRLAK